MSKVTTNYKNPMTCGDMQVWNNGSDELIIQTAYNSIRVSLTREGVFRITSNHSHPMRVDGLSTVHVG